MNSHEFSQFPSLEHILAALPVGAVVSPALVPLAACVSGVGSPVPAAAFVASLPAAVRGFRCRVCPWPCSCGKRAACCRCPSLAVVLAASASPSCVLVWLAAPPPTPLDVAPPPAPRGCGPALVAVRAAEAARSSSSPIRVAVVGSRGFSELSLVSSFVAQLPSSVAVVSGAAAGVDRVAENAARLRGLPVISLPAAWSRFEQAGVIRNAEVIRRADMVVAFWDGVSPGTQNAIRRARKAGIPVFVISPPPAPDAPAQLSLF